MVVYWKVWFDCKAKKTAEVVARKAYALLAHGSPPMAIRADAVVNTIATAQRVGTGWTLLGDILSAPEGLLSRNGGARICVPGVTMVTWSLVSE